MTYDIEDYFAICESIGRTLKKSEAEEIVFWMETYELDDITRGVEAGRNWARKKAVKGEDIRIYHVKFFNNFICRGAYGFNSVIKHQGGAAENNNKGEGEAGTTGKSQQLREGRERKNVELSRITGRIARHCS